MESNIDLVIADAIAAGVKGNKTYGFSAKENLVPVEGKIIGFEVDKNIKNPKFSHIRACFENKNAPKAFKGTQSLSNMTAMVIMGTDLDALTTKASKKSPHKQVLVGLKSVNSFPEMDLKQFLTYLLGKSFTSVKIKGITSFVEKENDSDPITSTEVLAAAEVKDYYQYTWK